MDLLFAFGLFLPRFGQAPRFPQGVAQNILNLGIHAP